MEIKGIIGDYGAFFRELLKKVQDLGIEVDRFPVDHLCYRVETLERYEVVKNLLTPLSKARGENIHHDRPIAKFLLKNPLEISGYRISLIELPAPKPIKFYPEGLEHFEMVVGEQYPNFREKYKDLWTAFEDS